MEWEAYDSPRWPVARANLVEARTRLADCLRMAILIRIDHEACQRTGPFPRWPMSLPLANFAFIVKSTGSRIIVELTY